MYQSVVQEKLDENPQKDFVYRIVRDGYNIIPVSGKFPPCIPWKEYQARQVTIKEICEWGRNLWPKKNGSGSWSAKILNYALPTGKKPYSDAPAIVVIDADDAEAEALVNSRCPDTPVRQRTSRGLQRVYRRPPEDEIVYIPNRQKTHFGGKEYNLDIRGDGGYIMCPGSEHPVTHTLYQEEQCWSRELIDQAPVYDPAWIPDEKQPATLVVQDDDYRLGTYDAEELDAELMEIDLPVSMREAQARVYLAGVPGSQQGTGADRSCASLTMRILYGFALPPSRAVAVLSEWGRRGDHIDKDGYPYPWKTDEIRRKIEWSLGQAYHGEIGDKLHTVSGDLNTIQIEDYFRGKADEDREEERREALENESDWGIPNKNWPDATRFDQFNVAPFPLEVVKELVPEMYHLCKDVAYHVQVPVDVPALMALSVLAVAASKKIMVSIRPNVYDYTHLWTIGAMLPGDRKTPGINPVRQPVIEYEAKLRAKMQGDVNCRKSQRKVANERLKAMESKARHAKDDDLPAMYLEMAKLHTIAESPEPTLPQILVDDITPEALGILLNANDGKAACLSDESTFLEIGLGRYSGTPNFDLYIQGHQGGTGKVNRVGREPLMVPSVHLDIGMCIQIEPLMRLVNDPIARQKGFTDRFLIALPTSLLGNRKVVMESISHEVTKGWSDLVHELLITERPRRMSFDADGFQALKEFEEKYEKTYKPTGELHSLASWCSKAMPGQLCRVAGLLHYGSRNTNDVIPLNVLRAAMTIIEYAIEHMKVLYNLKVQDKAVLIAKEIQGQITRNKMARFSFAQFKSTLRIIRDCDDKALLEEAYDLLVRHNIIRESPNEKKRGRPTRQFEVNPSFVTNN